MRARVIHRIEIYAGPDRDGFYSIAKFWMTDYSPGHPLGENVTREHGQHFLVKSWDVPAKCEVLDKRR